MKCENLEKLMVSFVDGRLSTAEREELERHFAVCASCRMRAEEFRRLWLLLDEMPTVEASPAFEPGLRERIRMEPAGASSLWGWLVPQFRTVFATGALILFAVVLLRMPPASNPNQPGSRQGGSSTAQVEAVALANADEQLKLLENLPVLEDYEMLDNFEALSELPGRNQSDKREM